MTAHTGAGNVTSNSVLLDTQITVDKPANCVTGEWVAVALHFQQASGTPDITPASGFVLGGKPYAATGDSRRPSAVYIKQIAPGEPSSWVFATTSAAGRCNYVAQRHTDVHPTVPWAGKGDWKTPINTDTTYDLPAVEIPVDGCTLVAFGYDNASAGTALPTVDVTTADSLTLAAQTQIPGSGTNASSTLFMATKAVDAGTTSPIGITWSTTPANSTGYAFGLRPPGRVRTTTAVIAHRGVATYNHGVAAQGPTEEESILGLQNLLALVPDVAGVEIDARLPSDIASVGRPVLCHDDTTNRTSPNPGAPQGTVSSMTTAQLIAAGMTFLDDYLDYIVANEIPFTRILIQHYTAVTVTAVGYIVDTIQAQPQWLQNRVVIMTDDSTFAAEELRAAGWLGDIGSYGSSAANWATFSGEYASENVSLLFTNPSDATYITNRSHITTIKSNGYQAGGSTINGIDVMDMTVIDGCAVCLTDDAPMMAAAYSNPTLHLGKVSEIASLNARLEGARQRAVPQQVPGRGGWRQLMSILADAEMERNVSANRQRVDCPMCGTPLALGPGGVLYCPFDGWRAGE